MIWQVNWWHLAIAVVVSLVFVLTVTWLAFDRLMPKSEPEQPKIDRRPSGIPAGCDPDFAAWAAELDAPSDLEAFADDFSEWEAQP